MSCCRLSAWPRTTVSEASFTLSCVVHTVTSSAAPMRPMAATADQRASVTLRDDGMVNEVYAKAAPGSGRSNWRAARKPVGRRGLRARAPAGPAAGLQLLQGLQTPPAEAARAARSYLGLSN